MAARAEGEACDIIVTAKLAVTMDAANFLIPDAAIAIGGNRILAAGPSRDIFARYRAERHVGSDRHIVIPGLVNTHNHTPIMVVRGMLEDLGFAPAYTPNVPQGNALSEEEAYLLSRLGLYEMLRFGSTTVVDFYRHPQALARALVESGLRGFVGGRIMDVDAVALARGEWSVDRQAGEGSFSQAFAFAEAWAGRHPLVTPVAGPHAADTCSPELLRQVARRAIDAGLSLHTHLHQSEAEIDVVTARTGRRPVELMHEAGVLGPTTVAAHCIHMTEADMALFGSTGAHVAHVPVGNAASGRMAPVVDLLRHGANVSLATDTKSGDMFEAMKMGLAVSRLRDGGFRLNSADVLGWATLGGARALGLASELGVIAPGYRADLVVVDGDVPNLVPLIDGPGSIVHGTQGSNVDTVLIDGRIVLERGRPTLFDGEEVLRAAQTVALGLWRRAGHVPKALAA